MDQIIGGLASSLLVMGHLCAVIAERWPWYESEGANRSQFPRAHEQTTEQVSLAPS